MHIGQGSPPRRAWQPREVCGQTLESVSVYGWGVGGLAREGQPPDLFCLEDSPPHPPFSLGAGLMRKGETHPTRTDC